MDIEKPGNDDLELLKAAHFVIALKNSIKKKLLDENPGVSQDKLNTLVEEQTKLISSYRDIIIEKCEINRRKLTIREGYIVADASIALAPRSIDKSDVESDEAIDVASRIISKIESNINFLIEKYGESYVEARDDSFTELESKIYIRNVSKLNLADKNDEEQPADSVIDIQEFLGNMDKETKPEIAYGNEQRVVSDNVVILGENSDPEKIRIINGKLDDLKKKLKAIKGNEEIPAEQREQAINLTTQIQELIQQDRKISSWWELHTKLIDFAGSNDLEKIRSIGHEIAKIVDDIIINSESEMNEVAEQASKRTNK